MILNAITNINFGYNSIKRSYAPKLKEIKVTQQKAMSEKEAFILKGEAEFALYNSKRIKKHAQDMALIAQNAKCNAKELYQEKRELMEATFAEIATIEFDEDRHCYKKYGEPNGEWQLHQAWNEDRYGKITMKEFDKNGKLIKEVEYKNGFASVATLNSQTGKMDVVRGRELGFFGCEVETINMGYEKTQDGYKADEVYTFNPRDTFDKLINFELGYSKSNNVESSEMSFDFKDYFRNQSKGFTCEIGTRDFKTTSRESVVHEADRLYLYNHSGDFNKYSVGVREQKGIYPNRTSTISYKEDYIFDSMGDLKTYETGKIWVSGKELKANSKAEFDGSKVSKVNTYYVENYEHNTVSSKGEFHF